MEKAENKVITKKRIEYIDIVRGLAMLCIIAGHMGNNTIIRIVFTFHVPLFFIISGLFFKGDLKHIRTDAIKLLKPYVFTVICVAFFDCIKALLQQKTLEESLKLSEILSVVIRDFVAGLYGSGSRVDFLNLNLTAIGAIWFYLALIWALLLCWIILQLEKKMLNQNRKQYVPGVLFFAAFLFWLIGYLSAKVIWLPLSVQAGLCAVVFVVIGTKAKGYFIGRQNNSIWLFIAAGLLWIISLYFSLTNDYMSIVRSAFPNPIINIIGAISATWLLIEIGKRTERFKILKPLKYFGEYSMVVLSFHLIELNCFPWSKLIHFDMAELSWLSRILIFGAKIIWCCIGIELAKRIKLLKWVYSIK